MKSKVKTYFLISMTAFICLFSIYAFDQKEDEFVDDDVEMEAVITPLVQKFLDEKLNRYKKTILDKCRTKAYEAAETYIDSLVADELKLLASDTLKFPAKPTRPVLKAPIILNDSTSISPIIK